MLLVLLPIGGVGQVTWQESVAETIHVPEAVVPGSSCARGEVWGLEPPAVDEGRLASDTSR
jgi:hypothetical protein